jgi:hypothetical protein
VRSCLTPEEASLLDEAVGAEGAKATLGKGSLSIEEVRLSHGANGESIDF